MDFIKTEYLSITKWFPVQKYHQNKIVLKNQNEVYVYRVQPINFSLKSLQEQKMILKAFQQELKKQVSEFQIVIQTDRVALESHFKKMLQINQNNPHLCEMLEDYIHFIGCMVKQNESVIRKYYLVMPGKNQKQEDVMAGLQEVGNDMTKLSEREVEEMLVHCFRKDTKMRRDAKWV